MKGKGKCKILKDIRRKIAEENGIDYVTTDCKYQGDCTGTCPKCESEVRYLEAELEKRRNAGKSVLVAGIAASMVVAMPGCASSTPAGTSPTQSSTEITQTQPSQSDPTHVEVVGEIYIPESTAETEPSDLLTMGVIPMPSETETTELPVPGGIEPPTEITEELMGDPVAEYWPDGF